MTTIGIVCGLGDKSFFSLHRAYVEAVQAAGGIPVLIPAAADAATMADPVVTLVDGLLLAGGGDVHPGWYGQQVRASLHGLDHARDELELRLLDAALQAEKRVLGICRGAQLLAVAHGGSLIQDLFATDVDDHVSFAVDAPYAGIDHPIRTEPGSLAERLLTGLTAVNSQHHQGIEDPGRLVASAWSKDGVIEAVEGVNCFGVQWHPELAYRERPANLQPFEWLVRK